MLRPCNPDATVLLLWLALAERPEDVDLELVFELVGSWSPTCTESFPKRTPRQPARCGAGFREAAGPGSQPCPPGNRMSRGGTLPPRC